MSSTYSPEPGAASLPTPSSDTAASGTSSGKASLKRSSKRGKPTACSMWLPSSETCGSSFDLGQPESIVALRTWLVATFPVSPSPSPASEPGVPTNAICGPRSPRLYARFDPDSCSLKTFQDLLPGMEELTSGASSVPWPRSGTVSDGRCWELTMPALRTGARDSGYWPTPAAENPGAGPNNSKVENLLTGSHHSFYLSQAVEAERRKPGTILRPTPNVPNGGRTMTPEDALALGATDKGKRQVGLENAVRFWPTPTKQDSSNTAGPSQFNRNSLPLNAAVGGPSTRPTYPTPNCGDADPRVLNVYRMVAGQNHLQQYVTTGKGGGQLNPSWVEWLMCWPINWTSLEPLSEVGYRAWLVACRTALADFVRSVTGRCQ